MDEIGIIINDTQLKIKCKKHIQRIMKRNSGRKKRHKEI
jgi:hypothetical protein